MKKLCLLMRNSNPINKEGYLKQSSTKILLIEAYRCQIPDRYKLVVYLWAIFRNLR